MKTRSFIIWLVLGLCLSPLGVTAAETIKNFTATYELRADSTVAVTETITYDFDTADRRGIFRSIEHTHPQNATAWWKQRQIDIEVTSVTRSGNTEPFLVSDGQGMTRIRIGDADQTITGTHTYEINYQLHGALSYDEEATEFYWQVTGTDWVVPIGSVQATVQAVSGVMLESDTHACYQGVGESTGSCDVSTRLTDGAVKYTAENLAAGEGLTIAVAIDPATVPVVRSETSSYIVFVLPLLLGWFLVLFWQVYRLRTKDTLAWPRQVQYNPYQEKPPMYTGYLFDKTLNPRDISAGIIYLAEQGFITITRVEKTIALFFSKNEYELTLQRPIHAAPNDFLVQVLELLFDRSQPPTSVQLGDLRSRTSHINRSIQNLQTSFKEELTTAGFTTTSLPEGFKTWCKSFAFLVISLLAVAVLRGGGWWALLIGFIVGNIIVYSLAVQPRFTRAGHEAYQHIRGFKHYMQMTDKERFAFHNAPSKDPEQFMEFLPYAVALGVEKEWAKVFADVTIPTPDWYSDSTHRTFSAAGFTSELTAFSSAVAQSGASGSTGSSGGGSVGGGGGGGGGGSW